MATQSLTKRLIDSKLTRTKVELESALKTLLEDAKQAQGALKRGEYINTRMMANLAHIDTLSDRVNTLTEALGCLEAELEDK